MAFVTSGYVAGLSIRGMSKHDRLVGRIDYSSRENEISIEVDGRRITMDQLKNVLSAYEGFELFLEIKEQSER